MANPQEENKTPEKDIFRNVRVTTYEPGSYEKSGGPIDVTVFYQDGVKEFNQALWDIFHRKFIGGTVTVEERCKFYRNGEVIRIPKEQRDRRLRMFFMSSLDQIFDNVIGRYDLKEHKMSIDLIISPYEQSTRHHNSPLDNYLC
jgi:hypothetical protein